MKNKRITFTLSALAMLALLVVGCSKPKSENYVSGYQSGYAVGEMTVNIKGIEKAAMYWESEKASKPQDVWIAKYEANNPDRIQDSQALHDQACGIWDGMEDAMLSRGQKY